ncbi:DUF1326 domain-containing protein [Nucisporomicrobium flavum]|uniref:DUF1326 domain-containing protein n=1 Tax=Nucisporomicrobium flavum TaxID=2785915 RepID=UPI0018F4C173|nr:DUF1326 domain-containing protein [Nucisporomicrobium flavum]
MVATPYRMTGEFLELCDCYTVCPCWLGLSPDEDACSGAFAWSVEKGVIGDVDVSGRRAVSVSFFTDHRDTGGQEVFLFVDDGADDRQLELLAAAFTGELGGPLGELSTLLGTLYTRERTTIEIQRVGRITSLRAGRQVSGVSTTLLGGDGQVMRLASGRLSEVLGDPAEVGQSATFRADLGPERPSVEVSARSAMRGRFHYVHEGSV